MNPFFQKNKSTSSRALCAQLVFFCLIGGAAHAAYPDFDSGKICNRYPVAIGKIDKITSTTTYISGDGVYINLKTSDGTNVGGAIYPRYTGMGYPAMVRMAIMAQILKTNVKVCYSGDSIYALEIETVDLPAAKR